MLKCIGFSAAEIESQTKGGIAGQVDLEPLTSLLVSPRIQTFPFMLYHGLSCVPISFVTLLLAIKVKCLSLGSLYFSSR